MKTVTLFFLRRNEIQMEDKVVSYEKKDLQDTRIIDSSMRVDKWYLYKKHEEIATADYEFWVAHCLYELTTSFFFVPSFNIVRYDDAYWIAQPFYKEAVSFRDYLSQKIHNLRYQDEKVRAREMKCLWTNIQWVLEKVIFILEQTAELFTHYDLHLGNILLWIKNDQIKDLQLIDFEFSFCANVDSTPWKIEMESRAEMKSLFHGIITPSIYDPYIDIIVLLTSFFDAWTWETRSIVPSLSNYFDPLKKDLFDYWKSCGLPTEKDPRYLESSTYLLTEEQKEYLQQHKKLKSFWGRYIPCFKWKSTDKPIAWNDLTDALTQDMTSKELALIWTRFKVHRLSQVKKSGAQFRADVLNLIQKK